MLDTGYLMLVGAKRRSHDSGLLVARYWLARSVSPLSKGVRGLFYGDVKAMPSLLYREYNIFFSPSLLKRRGLGMSFLI